MLINGKKVEGANVEIIVIPRGEGEDIVFKAQAVLKYDDFNKLCPAPIPPKVRRKDGLTDNIEDPQYLTAVAAHGRNRTNWIVIQSLKATEGLEWETVKYDNCDTWGFFDTELRESGFSEIEIQRIFIGVMTANALNEGKIEEARKRFLAGQSVIPNGSSKHQPEQNSTPSSEPVNASN